jgi:hypothetical protein
VNNVAQKWGWLQLKDFKTLRTQNNLIEKGEENLEK